MLLDRCGHLIGSYRKTHLYDAFSRRESNGIILGDRLLLPVKTDVGVIGLLVCYELRFPEVSRTLALKGAEVLAKLFTFNETWESSSGVSGVALDFSSKMAMNFREINQFHTTPVHELNHSIGLRHTFVDRKAPYLFARIIGMLDSRTHTDNIMSYSDRIPAMTWHWQWKMANRKLR